MSRTAVQLWQIIWRTMTDSTARVYGFRNNASVCACRSLDGLMCCFDVWFVAQFLRDKCAAADFGFAPLYGQRARGLLHARTQIRNFGLSCGDSVR